VNRPAGTSRAASITSKESMRVTGLRPLTTHPPRARLFGRRAMSAAASVAFVLVGMFTIIPGAQADFGFESTSAAFSGADGQFSRQAGAHPDFQTDITFSYNHTDDRLYGDAKDIAVSLPPGYFANPAAMPTCVLDEFMADVTPDCPPETQVGIVAPQFAPRTPSSEKLPIYNLPHPPGSPALFGFKVLRSFFGFIEAQVDPDDFGITGISARTSQAKGLFGASVTLWGVPSDPSHFQQRRCRGSSQPPDGSITFCESSAPRRPFFTAATSCPGSSSNVDFSVNSWQQPDLFARQSVFADPDGTLFINEGCEKLRFDPTLSVVPGSHQAAAPTGLSVDIKVPQNEDPDGLATPQVKKTVITFPKGVAISASAANGLTSCSSAQIGIGTAAPPTCPDSSKLGTVVVKTPLLHEELHGNIILAKQNDNPFPNPSLLALYMVVKGPGFYLKFPGKTEIDKQTGQVTTTFDNTPQLPFEDLKVNLDSGPRAALTTPETCGTYYTRIEMTPWSSNKPVSIKSPIEINEGCNTGGFNPGINVGAVNPLGGRYSPFTFQVIRQDGEQNISRIEATFPPGEVAKLAGVPLCPEAALAAGACPAASKIGTVTVGAGVGANPTYIPEAGRPPSSIYLAGPYKGTGYSLVVQVPAQAGPLDVGVVNSRVSLGIDPSTVQVTTKSDPLPQLLEGIPVTYRDIRVEVNRPDFTLNPTSCDPMKVTSAIFSAQGKVATPSDRFQVANCDQLGFKPKLAIRLIGKTHRSAHPVFKATLTARAGDANIRRAAVTLPKTEFLENAHIKTICTRVQFAVNACPERSIYGHAKAWTPLLDQPVEGPVYLRSSSHELPDLVASLDGGIHVDVVGRIDSVHARIRNTFDVVPDAPVSKFVLTMQGGKKGLLVNNTELCKTTPRARALFEAHNGKVQEINPVAKADCGKRAKKNKKRR
jgi:hypothetical protein